MAGLGTTEILLIVLALFLLFGASRLPQLAKSLGQTRKAFKEGMGEKDEVERVTIEKGRLNQTPSPQISNLSDDEIRTEMRRRVSVK